MVRSDVQASLTEVLFCQQDIVARAQLMAAGIDDVSIYRHVRRSEWQRVLPGIYRVAPGPLTLEHRRIAAALFAGDDGQLTGAATLLWYGFKSPLASDRVQVIVPHETRRRSAGFVTIQRALSMDANARDAGIYRVTSPARAVVDACRLMTDLRGVRAIVSEAVQGGFVGIKAIDEEIRRAARSRTALARRALTEVSAGVRSSPEAELRELLSRSDILPAILWNPLLVGLDDSVLPTPDGWIADTAIGLEVDSQEHHASGDGWRRTLRRHNALSALGALVLHFTPAEIRDESTRVLRVVEQAYRSRVGSSASIKVIERGPS